MRGSWVLGFGVLLLAVAACSGESDEKSEDDDASGGSNGTGGSSGAPSDWATACSRSADILCDKLQECSPFFLSALLPADCVTYYGSTCRSLSGLPGATITPASLLACYEAYEQTSCDDLLYNQANPPECELTGTRGAGSPCSDSVQCQSGSCSGGASACGVCEILATEGQSCEATSCIRALDCSVDGVCVRRKRLGESCTVDDPCPIFLTCTSGVCSKPPGPGAPCGTDGLGLSCDLFRGATCNEALLCETIDVPALGEVCEGICAAGAYCNDDTTPPTCVPTPGEGAVCNVELGPDCTPPLECTNGTCTRFDPASCG